jgi:hypothetical protein
MLADGGETLEGDLDVVAGVIDHPVTVHVSGWVGGVDVG